MRIYLIGPMTILRDRGWGREVARRVAEILRNGGYEVVSPWEMDEAIGHVDWDSPELPKWFDYEATLASDFKIIDTCEAVCVLPGWGASSGGKRELAHAVDRGLMTCKWSEGKGLCTLYPSEYYSLLEMKPDSQIRTFDTGANRDTTEGKFDIEAALDPGVLEDYVGYLDKHSVLADGTKRSADNWKKGMPTDVYAKSLTRHFWQFWKNHQQGVYDPDVINACLFNLMGYAYEKREGR